MTWKSIHRPWLNPQPLYNYLYSLLRRREYLETRSPDLFVQSVHTYPQKLYSNNPYKYLLFYSKRNVVKIPVVSIVFTGRVQINFLENLI